MCTVLLSLWYAIPKAISLRHFCFKPNKFWWKKSISHRESSQTKGFVGWPSNHFSMGCKTNRQVTLPFHPEILLGPWFKHMTWELFQIICSFFLTLEESVDSQTLTSYVPTHNSNCESNWTSCWTSCAKTVEICIRTAPLLALYSVPKPNHL